MKNVNIKSYLSTQDKRTVKEHCNSQIKNKDSIRIKSLAVMLENQYAMYELMDYIKNDLNISDDYIWRCKDTYLCETHGHIRLSRSDVYYSNVYQHQYVVHKAFDIPMEVIGKYIIHHIDSDKHNNNINNLWIFFNPSLHRAFHIELEKNPNISISKFTKNWIEDNINNENRIELTEYLKLILKAENTKKCLSLNGLDDAI
ncbi:HNH endonuclease [Clostridium sp.]|uniref:HNH endonuclease n=1 Tax=Clostridium sp. TaxID=1506 RepID=UPI00283D17D8|nr:HNH endonuclease [Clostridium sp.]MDR3594236.1 HNH endonuclease [Clostridium sp.]